MIKPKGSSLLIWFKAEIEYELTELDLVTLGWSCVGEGGSNNSKACSAIIWSQATRFMHYKWSNGYYPTLESLVRAFSQPVNPKWLKDGEKCKDNYTVYPKEREDFKNNTQYKDWLKEYRKGLTPNQKMCTEDRILRRERFNKNILDMNTEDLPPIVFDMVQTFAKGLLDNPLPTGVDDFRSLSTSSQPNSGIQIGGNVYSRSAVSVKAQKLFGNHRKHDFKVIYNVGE